MTQYSLTYMKGELDERKQLAAQLLVENEFKGGLTGERRTLEEIANEELNVSRQTLHAWRKDPVFTAYMAYLSDRHLDAQRAFVDSQLMKLIAGTSNNGTPSVKSIEMFYKLQNRLIERSVVETTENTRELSQEQIDAGIDELARKLRGE